MFHSHFTGQNLKVVMDALVKRILAEHAIMHGKPKKTLDMKKGQIRSKRPDVKQCEFRIAKCWSVIRYVAEHPFFSNELVAVVE